jgi:isoamylase
MLLAGDELGRTQHGNNNGHCQDNELSWLHWPADQDGTGSALTEVVRQLIRLRADQPVLRRRRFFTGRTGQGAPARLGDIGWLTPAGAPMTEEDWATSFAKSLAVFLNGDAISEPGSRGEPIEDDSFLLLFNAAEREVDFTIPPAGYGEQWVLVLDTADPWPSGAAAAVKPGDVLAPAGHSLRVLRRA